MSLTLWEFFWAESDWTGAPPAVSSSAAAVVSTKFGSRGNDYHPLPDDFWEIREDYLRRYVKPILRTTIDLETSTVIPIPPDLPLEEDELFILQHKRNEQLRRAMAASNIADLERTSARVIKLSLDISAYISQYYRRAAIILLLDLF
jgi:hypothetical protein